MGGSPGVVGLTVYRLWRREEPGSSRPALPRMAVFGNRLSSRGDYEHQVITL
ncbi:MAG TPA: hypothetical protein PKE20_10980 [Promineifilum sp.]|nr:hypothetical protein [Promineifilum sp.]